MTRPMTDWPLRAWPVRGVKLDDFKVPVVGSRSRCDSLTRFSYHGVVLDGGWILRIDWSCTQFFVFGKVISRVLLLAKSRSGERPKRVSDPTFVWH